MDNTWKLNNNNYLLTIVFGYIVERWVSTPVCLINILYWFTILVIVQQYETILGKYIVLGKLWNYNIVIYVVDH